MNYLEARPEPGDLSQWAQHINAPFSPACLGDPLKPYVTVEGLGFPDRLCRFEAPDEDWSIGINQSMIKGWNEPDINLTCRSDVCTQRLQEGDCDEPDLASPLHLAFQGVARRVLGEESYTQATIELTLWRGAVELGRGQTPRWHLDTNKPSLETTHKDGKCLVGIISDTLLTEVLLNPTCPSDYEGGDLHSVMGVPLDKAKLRVRTLRPNTLTVLPMGIPHRGQIAQERIPRRHFIRWHLYD